MVGVLKGISAAEVFEKFPEVKKELWGGEFWEDGYFARTVGDKVTAEPSNYSSLFCFFVNFFDPSLN